jgi:gamma-glutamylaminecyclotransferase
VNKFLVFVYGSLKKGFHNHRLLETGQAIFKGTAESVAPEYAMVDLGSFPGLIDGKQRVTGELYEVDAHTFHRLDSLEGHPHMYTRHERRFRMVGENKLVQTAWVYLYNEGGYTSRTKLDECFWTKGQREV